MPPVHLLIKPASSLCNMACRYCFYRDEAKNRSNSCYGVMSTDTVDAMMEQVFRYAEGSVAFTFQGGEPTLAGEDYFQHFHEAVQRYNIRRLPVCRGGCRRHRDDGAGKVERNRYCEAYRIFFDEKMPLLLEMARRIG